MTRLLPLLAFLFGSLLIAAAALAFAPGASAIERRLGEVTGTHVKASGDEAKQLAKTNIAKRLTYLNDQFANRQFLTGSSFTVADAYAFTIVNWTNFVGIDLKPYPNVAAYMARIGARPKVQETLKAEGLLK